MHLKSLGGQQINHQVYLNILYLIFFLNYGKENFKNILALNFLNIFLSFYRALLLKEIKIVKKNGQDHPALLNIFRQQ